MLFVLVGACAAPAPGGAELSESASALATCNAVDDADTTCDGVDDDCDGTLDEDCDFGPSDCPTGTHVIAGSAGCDWLWGTSGRDCILGYGGNDVLFGLEGDDILIGGDGRDTLAGWGGRDQLQGDRGDDTLLGDGGDDQLDGGDGNDSLFGGDGRDVMHGGLCQDWLFGSSGSDVLAGDDGVDRIEGSSYDSIDGGGGKDACTGISCELQGTAARFCVRNSDCPSGLRCVRRSHVCASASDVPTSDASCDGYDDDCDGRSDEDYVPVVTHCGGGSCGGTGMTACVGGEIVDSCDSGGGSGGGGGGGSDASCDGVDDDCDGALDEDYVSQVTSCGTGACAATGSSACVGGAVVNSCTAGTPAGDDSACNGSDDDCDGAVDEGFAPQPTTCGTGACAASGATACIPGGVVDSCTAGTPAGDDSACNGSDDDCDGAVDEAFASQPTTCGTGACAASGATACSAGVVTDSCSAGSAASDDASCNGVDDDCNGQVDEDYAPAPTSCAVAGCSATGSLVCEAGALRDTCLTAPVCVGELACNDDLDNDGDGLADCDDADCSSAPACHVQTFSLSVAGSSNIWGAGHAIAPGAGGGSVPPGIMLELGAGAVVTFTSVSGTVTHSFTPIPPDGLTGTLPLPSHVGIAGYTHGTRQRGMSAVFLGPAEPADPAPAQLSFADGEFTSLSPGLGQMFYVGDGRTSGSVVQTFVVPAGATRLFIGTPDLCATALPGCFSDNTGGYSVTGEVRNP